MVSGFGAVSCSALAPVFASSAAAVSFALASDVVLLAPFEVESESLSALEDKGGKVLVVVAEPKVNFTELAGSIVSVLASFVSSLFSATFVEGDEKTGIREGSALTPEGPVENEKVGCLTLAVGSVGSSADRFLEILISLEVLNIPGENGVRAGLGAASVDGWGRVVGKENDAGFQTLDPVAGFTFDELNAEPKPRAESEALIALAAPKVKPNEGLSDGKSTF